MTATPNPANLAASLRSLLAPIRVCAGQRPESPNRCPSSAEAGRVQYMDESVIREYDQLFKWDGRKRKQTVFGAKLGRLVVTNVRVVFLSSGSNDLTLGKFVAGGLGSPLAVLRSSSTSNLDESAIAKSGGVDIPLNALTIVEVKGKFFKTLMIGFSTGDGEKFATFAPKNGPFMGGELWVDAIHTAKADLAGMKDRS